MDILARDQVARAMRIVATMGLANYVGGSWYIAYSVHPSAMSLAAKDMIKFRQGTVARARPLPGSYMSSMVLAAGSYFVSRGTSKEDIGWLYVAGGILITIPYTFKFILPINHQFGEGEVTEETAMGLMEKWNSLHFPRTLFLTGVFIYMLHRLSS